MQHAHFKSKFAYACAHARTHKCFLISHVDMASVHAHMRVYSNTWIHASTNTHMYTYIDTYIHTNIYIQTYIQTYIRTYMRNTVTYVITYVTPYMHTDIPTSTCRGMYRCNDKIPIGLHEAGEILGPIPEPVASLNILKQAIHTYIHTYIYMWICIYVCVYTYMGFLYLYIYMYA